MYNHITTHSYPYILETYCNCQVRAPEEVWKEEIMSVETVTLWTRRFIHADM